jgi:hypothetical protein
MFHETTFQKFIIYFISSQIWSLELLCQQLLQKLCESDVDPQLLIGQKIYIICVFTVTGQKNLGSGSQDYYYYFFIIIIDKTGNSRSRFRNPIFHFQNFW